MAVKIVHAARDERGKYKGGKKGDNNGREIFKQNYYVHPKTWGAVIRPNDPEVAEAIATCGEKAAANDNCGYDQNDRHSGINEAAKYDYDPSKIKVKCSFVCSTLVRLGCLYAGIKVPHFLTKNQAATLKATGKFKILTSTKYTRSSHYLKRGDILCTPAGISGHTVIVISDGSKVKKKYSGLWPKLPNRGYFKLGDGYKTLTQYKKSLKRIQRFLNWAMDAKLKVDGEYGPKTQAAVLAFQKKYGVKATSQWGKLTLAKAKTIRK